MHPAENLVAIAAWLVVGGYIFTFVRGQLADSDTPNRTLNLAIRRLYLLGFSLGGLVMVAWGSFGLLQNLMEMLAQEVWPASVAHHVVQVLLGTALWVGHWRMVQAQFFNGPPAERASVLRKVYLYLTVFIFSIITIVGGTLLFEKLIGLLLGLPLSDEPLIVQLSEVVPMLIVGGVVWAYQWHIIRQDAELAPDGPRQAEVRRTYAYLVATVGLFATVLGVGGLLTLLIDMLTNTGGGGGNYYRQTVSAYISLTMMGLPVWILPWYYAQNRAVLPPADPGQRDEGGEARRSVVRKIYLYLFVFLASLGIFGSTGWFVFHILTALLGADLPNDFLTLVLDALVIALLAAGVWAYHWWAIQEDGRRTEQAETAQLTEMQVVVVADGDGSLGQALQRKIKAALPHLSVQTIALSEATLSKVDSAVALNSEAAQAALAEASYIVGSWRSLSTTPAGSIFASQPATKLALPLPEENWLWVGHSDLNLKPDSQAEQAVQGLKQALAGDVVSFQTGPDVGTVIGIIIGGVVFFIIASGLVFGVLNLL
jgi:hypothetical protein